MPCLAMLTGWAATEADCLPVSLRTAQALVDGAGVENLRSIVDVDTEEGPLALVLIDALRERETRPHLQAHYDQLAAVLRDQGGVLIIATALVDRGGEE